MTAHATTESPTSTDTPLFSPVEIEQFDADDVTAGRAIGKMLSGLFLYTVIVMAIASWWTYSSIRAGSQGNRAAVEHGGH